MSHSLGARGGREKYPCSTSSVRGVCGRAWRRSPLLPVAPLGADGRLALLVAVAVLSAIFGILGNNAWVSWMSELVPERLRGRYFGRRTALCNVAGTLAGLAAGLALDEGAAGSPNIAALSALAVVAAAAGAGGDVADGPAARAGGPSPDRAAPRRDPDAPRGSRGPGLPHVPRGLERGLRDRRQLLHPAHARKPAARFYDLGCAWRRYGSGPRVGGTALGRPFYLGLWAMLGGLATAGAALAGGALAGTLPARFEIEGRPTYALQALFLATGIARFIAAGLALRIRECGAGSLADLVDLARQPVRRALRNGRSRAVAR